MVIESEKPPIKPGETVQKLFGNTPNTTDMIAMEAAAVVGYNLLSTTWGGYYKRPETLTSKLSQWMTTIPDRLEGGTLPFGFLDALGLLKDSETKNNLAKKWNAISEAATAIVNSHPLRKDLWDALIKDKQAKYNAIERLDIARRRILINPPEVISGKELSKPSEEEKRFQSFIETELQTGRIGAYSAGKLRYMGQPERDSVMAYAAWLQLDQPQNPNDGEDVNPINFYNLARFKGYRTKSNDSALFAGAVILTFYGLIDRLEQTRSTEGLSNSYIELNGLVKDINVPLRNLAGFYALYPSGDKVNWLKLHDEINDAISRFMESFNKLVGI